MASVHEWDFQTAFYLRKYRGVELPHFYSDRKTEYKAGSNFPTHVERHTGRYPLKAMILLEKSLNMVFLLRDTKASGPETKYM